MMQTDTPTVPPLGRLYGFTLGATSQQLLGSNPRRKTLVLSANNANRYTISFGAPAVLDQGITIQAGSAVLRLHYHEVGALMQQAIFAVASAANTPIGILEVSAP